jgi:hypothetical protein
MSEFISYSNTEQEAPRVSQALVIMYPDHRTTGGYPLLPGEQPESILTGAYHDFASRYIQRFKREGFSVFAVEFQDSTELTRVQIYPYDQFDTIVPVDVPYRKWSQDIHEELLESVIDRMNLAERARVVVGGYHATDCVPTMINVLKGKYFRAEANLLLTNMIGPHFVSRELLKLMSPDQRSDERRIMRENWETDKREFERLLTS